jgi:hypothetical protein
MMGQQQMFHNSIKPLFVILKQFADNVTGDDNPKFCNRQIFEFAFSQNFLRIFAKRHRKFLPVQMCS